MSGLEAVRIAVLLTCHNRKATTLACLEALFGQDLSGPLELRVFLVDDASDDGTGEAVRTRFPQVRVIPGDGHLYWCGGMRLAFATALNAGDGFAYYLWLNDDTLLCRDALKRLLATHRQLLADGRGRSIVVGATADPHTKRPTYGGFRRLWPLPFLRFARPAERPIRCTTMHGNCVLVPDAAARTVGNLDPALVHLRGDVDYGLRAGKLGFQVWLVPGICGTCEFHSIGRWRDLRLPLGERLAALREPKYALAEKILVARRHFGALWFLSPLAPYVYIFLSHPFGLLRRLAGR